jgi:hypothetical protein
MNEAATESGVGDALGLVRAGSVDAYEIVIRLGLPRAP